MPVSVGTSSNVIAIMSDDMNAVIPLKIFDANGNPVQPQEPSIKIIDSNDSYKNQNNNTSLNCLPPEELITQVTGKCPQRLALETKSICFKYKSSRRLVLNDVSIRIPEGTVYGLLGPSGCGKTSLLRCILNQLKPASGSISIFSSHPGEPGSLIPGPGVGYMPQEIALIMEFTILETIRFFGKLHGMKQQQLQERSHFLLKFLDLPDKNQLVRDLSGGQRRRVSLAAALVHSPPLLVLDEPTVGVDPLLREAIWEHLVSLAEEEHMTIIITTHYIEEARRAPLVGFMRRGKLLVQDNPESIINRCGTNCLEQAFLKICSLEENGNSETRKSDEDSIAEDERRSSFYSLRSFTNSIKAILDVGRDTTNFALVQSKEGTTNQRQTKSCDFGSTRNKRIRHLSDIEEMQQEVEDLGPKSSGLHQRTFGLHCNILAALTSKDVIKIKRSIPKTLACIMTPAMILMLIFSVIGKIPKGLPVAVYNPDHPPPSMTHYSRNLLDQVNEEFIHLNYFDSLADAIRAVETSTALAAIEFPKNYSYWLDQRVLSMFSPSEQIINGSTIRIHLDMTEFALQAMLGLEFGKAFAKFGIKFVSESNMLKFLVPWGSPVDVDKLLSPPVIPVDPPIFGNFKLDAREFATPAFILATIFVISCGTTALHLVQERNDGILERTLVAGVRSTHIFLTHSFIHVFVICLQGAFLFLVVVQLYEIPVKGLMTDAFLLFTLQGVAGMSMGFMLSSICGNERGVWMLTLALLFPSLILSGLAWPIEGMPYILRVISYFLPQTMAIKSMRSIISRGLGIGEWQVYIGFLSSIAWTIVHNFIYLLSFASDLNT